MNENESQSSQVSAAEETQSFVENTNDTNNGRTEDRHEFTGYVHGEDENNEVSSQNENAQASDSVIETRTTRIKDLRMQRTNVKTNNPAFAMVEIMKQNAELRKKNWTRKKLP